MKKITVLLVIIVLAVVLSGCECKHKWEEATCTEPKKCSLCGETEGEALGHDFAPATLDVPKTCRVCGETEGEPVTFGPVSLSFLEDAEFSYILTDSLCVALTEKSRSCYNFTFYDLDGNIVNEQTVDGRNGGWLYCFSEDCYMLATGDKSKTDFTIYDYNFETILEKRLDGYTISNDMDRMIKLDLNSFDGINRAYTVAGMKTYFGVDLKNRCECSAEEYYNAAAKYGVNPDYDTTKWSGHSYDEMINGYLVGTADGSSWGFVDLEDNEIKMFKDATEFTPSGYALVSNDGKTYDLIDTDMNVIGKNVVEGIGASRLWNSNAFIVYSEDGSSAFYAVNWRTHD